MLAWFVAGSSVGAPWTCSTPRPPASQLVDCSGGFGSNITEAWCIERSCCFDARSTVVEHRCTYAAAGVPVHTVHVIASNHFDAGYADLTADVVNQYFSSYFPRAAKVGEALGYPLRWMTHSFLVSLYLDCPSGMRLECPTAAEKGAFLAAVQAGHITWHAYPHNTELALGAIEFGVRLTHDIDARLGLPPKTTLSTRDVPGMTRAALAPLAAAGVRAVSEGMNGRMVPVNVPPAFVWRDPASNASLVALWHWRGYGSIEKERAAQPPLPLAALATAGRLRLMPDDPDFALRVPGSGHALVYAWRGDNAGPPTDVDEVYGWLEAVRTYFPGATPTLSTLDAFVDALTADGALSALPIITRDVRPPPPSPARDPHAAPSRVLTTRRCARLESHMGVQRSHSSDCTIAC